MILVVKHTFFSFFMNSKGEKPKRSRTRKNSNSNSKVLKYILHCLKYNLHSHMLSWENKDENLFKLKFIHKNNPNWNESMLSLFKATEEIVSKKRSKSYSDSPKHSELCKTRFRANLNKLCGTGALILQDTEILKDKSKEKIYKIANYYRSSTIGREDAYKRNGRDGESPSTSGGEEQFMQDLSNDCEINKIIENICEMNANTREKKVEVESQVSILVPVEIPSKEISHCLCLSNQVLPLRSDDTSINYYAFPRENVSFTVNSSKITKMPKVVSLFKEFTVDQCQTTNSSQSAQAVELGNEFSSSPQAVELGNEFSSSPRAVELGNVFSSSPQAVELGNEFFSSPQAIELTNEFSSSPRAVELGNVFSSSPWAVELGNEFSSSPQAVELGNWFTSASAQAVELGNEFSSSPQAVELGNEFSSSPQAVELGNEFSSSPQAVELGNEFSSSPQAVELGNEFFSSPQAVELTNEFSSSPQAVELGNWFTSASAQAVELGNRFSSPSPQTVESAASGFSIPPVQENMLAIQAVKSASGFSSSSARAVKFSTSDMSSSLLYKVNNKFIVDKFSIGILGQILDTMLQEKNSMDGCPGELACPSKEQPMDIENCTVIASPNVQMQTDVEPTWEPTLNMLNCDDVAPDIEHMENIFVRTVSVPNSDFSAIPQFNIVQYRSAHNSAVMQSSPLCYNLEFSDFLIDDSCDLNEIEDINLHNPQETNLTKLQNVVPDYDSDSYLSMNENEESYNLRCDVKWNIDLQSTLKSGKNPLFSSTR